MIVIRSPPDRRGLPEILRWLRVLVPAALLLVGPGALPDLAEAEVIQLDCADGLDGPLSVASSLARRLPRGP